MPKLKLPNYTSIHINQNGEVFHLTPIGGNKLEQYDDRYRLACQ
ncbi:MAG: hypothetical protein ACR2HS_02690 [Gammaproteobacteria bacterium]